MELLWALTPAEKSEVETEAPWQLVEKQVAFGFLAVPVAEQEALLYQGVAAKAE